MSFENCAACKRKSNAKHTFKVASPPFLVIFNGDDNRIEEYPNDVFLLVEGKGDMKYELMYICLKTMRRREKKELFVVIQNFAIEFGGALSLFTQHRAIEPHLH